MIHVPTKWRSRFRASKKPEIKDVPSITEQTPWDCALYDFGKAKIEGVDYFNPTLLERDDGRWLITRRSRPWNDFAYGINDIMAFKLLGNVPQYGVQVHIPSQLLGEHFEDPRIVSNHPGLMLSMCNFIVFNGGRQWTGAHQMLCEINKDWIAQRRFDPVYDGNGQTVSSNRKNQKNWLWFWHDNALHMIYWTRPHQVVRMNGRLELDKEYRTEECSQEWVFGEPRGGTPPVLHDGEYWTFFHSSLPWKQSPKGKKLRQYHMGAYAFEAKPPFRITKMTPRPLLSGSQKDPWMEEKPLVVFPCGALVKDSEWTVSMGVNDLCSAWIEIPHGELLKMVKPCSVYVPPAPVEVPTPADEAIFI